jgi:hypothetical protein
MNQTPFTKSMLLFLFVALAFISLGASGRTTNGSALPGSFSAALPDKGTEVVSLKDFTKEEVRGAGITLSKDLTVHISAVGGGDRSFWRDAFGDDESGQMYAAGWIIDANTRDVVWDMTMDNTSGRSDRRSFDKDVPLKKGSYEVYYAAYGFASGSGMSHWSINIDRRESHHSSDRIFGGLLDVFRGDNKERYEEFMDYARDTWGITLTVPVDEASNVQTFEAPRRDKSTVVAKTGVGDNVVFRKDLKVDREVTVHIYAVGEGRRDDDVDDFGWLVNTETRQRVWDMNLKDIEHAGGARKNIKYDGDVTLPKGTYELYYVTDGTHSNDDWNARPPYDPFNYGVTVTLANEKDRDVINALNPVDEEKNVLVKLTEMRDDDYKSAGFLLKEDTKVRIYALGESVDDNSEMADYGWIMNAKTREKVWKMDARASYHAGGAAKNRLFDEVITLPKGEYIACYQTDGSHSYDDWNADAPFDPEHWGLTIMGAGSDFDAKVVSTFNEDDEKGVIAQLVRVRDDEHVRQRFTISSRTTVRIYAIGEADDEEMVDYGWIKNMETGERVWEMEYDATSRAGGAKKNRMIDKTIVLDKGEYELNYRTDGSHAFNDWNDDPPDDPTHWGITLYRAQ